MASSESKREILVGFGVDVDAVAGWYVCLSVKDSELLRQSLVNSRALILATRLEWFLTIQILRLGSYGGHDSPGDISRVRYSYSFPIRFQNE